MEREKQDTGAQRERPSRMDTGALRAPDHDRLRDDEDRDDETGAVDEQAAFDAASADLRERGDEQSEFREQFDEDLYTDREDRPAQGNTADVAMEHRFGSDADAYSEYAWRRPGDHHERDGAAVGQSRDPTDSVGEDT